MKELQVNDKTKGQRLNKYLLKYLDNSTSSFIYKMLRKKNITLNGKKADGSEILEAGDVIKLFLSDETIDKFKKPVLSKKSFEINVSKPNYALDILYIDDDIMAVNKPIGVLSQKANEHDYSINEAICDYCFDKGIVAKNDAFKPSVCNRLDRNTSGIILAGISLKGSQYLSKLLKDRDFDKYYYTIVEGEFKNTIKDRAYIKKDKDNNKSYIIKADEYKGQADYKPIETHFYPVAYGENFTLLKVKLVTGKSHQIRVHLKSLGYPIIGDIKYGAKKNNLLEKNNIRLKFQLLHAGMVVFPDGRVIKAKLPAVFKEICDLDGIDTSDI